MQSSRRASSRRRSIAAAASLALLSASEISRAEAHDAERAPATPATATGPVELDPNRAFPERVILLLRTPGDEGVMTRLRAELVESEWRILEVRPDERDVPAALGTSAERERASAAVRVDARRGMIDLWVLRPDGPVEETIDASGDAQSEQILALRVSEALRARGLLLSRSESAPLAMAPQPAVAPEARVDSTPVVSSHDAPRPSGLWFALGPAVTLSPGGLEPLLSVDAGARWDAGERWSFCLDALLPVTRQSVSAAEGEADMATWLFGGSVELEWATLPFGGFRSALGAAGTVTTMSGSAGPGFAGVDDTVAAFAPLANTSFHLQLGRSFRLRSAVAVGATLPTVRIEFASREVARWGRPFVLMNVVLEANFGAIAAD